jgi:hypothetical protein
MFCMRKMNRMVQSVCSIYKWEIVDALHFAQHRKGKMLKALRPLRKRCAQRRHARQGADMWRTVQLFMLSMVGIPCGIALTITQHPWYVWALVTLAQVPNFLWGLWDAAQTCRRNAQHG